MTSNLKMESHGILWYLKILWYGILWYLEIFNFSLGRQEQEWERYLFLHE